MLFRLDVLLVEKNLVRSRRVGRDLIKSGNVKVNGFVVKKQGKRFDDSVKIEVTGHPKYVSRAGEKLAAALDSFEVDPEGKICLDVGASTGGFTDVLIQQGARKVFAVEVGTGQLADELSDDKKVVEMENTDIRNVKSLPQKAQIAVVDVSFISLTQILPSVLKHVSKDADIIVLIKPQFELPQKLRSKGGIIKGESKRQDAVKRIEHYCIENHLNMKKVIESPLQGAKGNIEYLAHITPGVQAHVSI